MRTPLGAIEPPVPPVRLQVKPFRSLVTKNTRSRTRAWAATQPLPRVGAQTRASRPTTSKADPDTQAKPPTKRALLGAVAKFLRALGFSVSIQALSEFFGGGDGGQTAVGVVDALFFPQSKALAFGCQQCIRECNVTRENKRVRVVSPDVLEVAAAQVLKVTDACLMHFHNISLYDLIRAKLVQIVNSQLRQLTGVTSVLRPLKMDWVLHLASRFTGPRWKRARVALLRWVMATWVDHYLTSLDPRLKRYNISALDDKFFNTYRAQVTAFLVNKRSDLSPVLAAMVRHLVEVNHLLNSVISVKKVKCGLCASRAVGCLKAQTRAMRRHTRRSGHSGGKAYS